jgi:tetratricopeptide (TPR) repeat protein
MNYIKLVPGARVSMGLALLLCSGTLVSCSNKQTRASQQIQATSAIENPIRILEARAELETLNPLPSVDEALIRRLLQDTTEPLPPGSQAYRKALMSAENIEIPVPVELEFGVPEPTETEIDPIKKGHALKIYTRVRTLRQLGQFEEAVKGLERAIELDPESTKLHRTMGDVRREMGDGVGSISSYAQALELGDTSSTTLVALATHAYGLNDYERVMSLCSMALDAEESVNQVQRTLAGIMLGNSQVRLGYLRAGAESLERALRSFSPEIRDPQWRQQIVQIRGRQAALWVMVGDAWSRVGSHARAADAYREAAALNAGGTGGLTSRRIAEHLREGHPATGMLLLIDHVTNNAHDLGPEESHWVEVLAHLPSLQGVLNDAIGTVRAERSALAPNVRRALMGLEIQGVDADEAIDRLGDAGNDARNPDAIARVLADLEDLDTRIEWASALIERNPGVTDSVADAMLTLPHSASLLMDALTDADELSLAASVALRVGRADLVPSLETDADFGSMELDRVRLIAQASGLQGDWTTSERALNELASRASRASARAFITSAISAQQPVQALERAKELTSSTEADTDEMLLMSRVASVLGEYERARDALELGAQLDPSDERIADQQIRLIGANGPLADEDAFQSVIRRLSETSARSELFSMIRVNDLARNGLLGEAETTLMQLNEQRRGDILGDDLLLSIWKTQESRGDTEALSRGQQWLSDRLDTYPNALAAGLALAKVHYERDELEEAISVLEQLTLDTLSFEAARAMEQLMRESGDAQGALSSLRQRIGESRGIDTTLELALVLAQSGVVADATEAADVLDDRLPSNVTLLPAQKQQLAQVVYTMAEHAETAGIDEPMLRVVNLIEDRTGPLDFFLARTKLLLRSRATRIDIEEIIGLVDQLVAQAETDQQRQQLEGLPIQVLLGEDRGHEAIALVTRMALRDGAVRDDLIVEVFRVLGAVGENSDLLGVLDALSQADAMEQVIEMTTSTLGTPERPIEGLNDDEQRADLAYTAGAMAMAFSRDEQSESYMRLALSFDEMHGWSNNDLGYLLIEQGEQIDDAEVMLERAAQSMPDQSNVIDSLGWLRYKQGVFENQVDEMTGTVVKQGAVPLLARANRLDLQRTNATILLHLGDALWRADRKQEAIEAWVGGESMIRSRLRVLNAQPQGQRNSGLMQSLGDELRTLRYRVQDAENGGEPDVAPTFEEKIGN